MTPQILHAFTAVPEWLQTHPVETGLAAGGLLTLGAAVGCVRRRLAQEGNDTRGSARWATPREIRAVQLFARHGAVLGRVAGQVLCDDGERHIAVFGPTGSGKGVGIVIPTLLVSHGWRESVLVLDPKDGENYAATVASRALLGPVYVFSPHTTPHTRINVYDSVRWGTPHEPDDVHVISRSLTAPEAMVKETPTSLHFRQLASWLLDAGGVHLHYTEPRKSIGGLWAFFTQQDSLQKVLTTMATATHIGGGVHPFVKERVNAIRNITGDRELSGVWTTATRPLEPFSHPYIAASTEASDIDLRTVQWGETPVSLYLTAQHPLSLERLAPVYRVVLDAILELGMRTKTHQWRHRLLTVGDEVAWYGYCRSLDKAPAVQRGYGQKNLLIFQNLGDLFDVFGENTPIWGNAHIKVFHAPSDDRTARRVSENMLGRGTITEESESRQVGLGGHRSVGTHAQGRELLLPDELMNLGDTEELLRVSGAGLHPILATKIDYRKELAWQ